MEKESRPVNQSQNIFEFDAIVDNTYGKVYTVKKKENPPVQCDIYSRKWVSDDAYPLYLSGEFPYMSGAFDYKGNERSDIGYTR